MQLRLPACLQPACLPAFLPACLLLLLLDQQHHAEPILHSKPGASFHPAAHLLQHIIQPAFQPAGRERQASRACGNQAEHPPAADRGTRLAAAARQTAGGSACREHGALAVSTPCVATLVVLTGRTERWQAPLRTACATARARLACATATASARRPSPARPARLTGQRGRGRGCVPQRAATQGHAGSGGSLLLQLDQLLHAGSAVSFDGFDSHLRFSAAASLAHAEV